MNDPQPTEADARELHALTKRLTDAGLADALAPTRPAARRRNT